MTNLVIILLSILFITLGGALLPLLFLDPKKIKTHNYKLANARPAYRKLYSVMNSVFLLFICCVFYVFIASSNLDFSGYSIRIVLSVFLGFVVYILFKLRRINVD